MTIAGSWYENQSLWAGAGVAVAIAALTIGAWATLSAAHPRRRFAYELRSVTPLVPPDGLLRQHVSVIAGGVELTDPYVVQVVLINAGRRDIPSTAFDSSAPIQLDLGARVISVLEVVTSPPHSAAPILGVSDQTIAIGPSLIATGQRIVISLLVDGSTPKLTVNATLIDVRVRPAPRYSNPSDQLVSSILAVLAFLFALGFALVSDKALAYKLLGASFGLLLAMAILKSRPWPALTRPHDE